MIFKKPESNNTSLVAYGDNDWIGDLDVRHSMTGTCLFFTRNLVTWLSKKQPTISRSSVEAEYRVLAQTTSEVHWCCYILRDLGVWISGTPMIKCDKQLMLFVATNPITRAGSRHLEVDFHFVRELLKQGLLRVQYVQTRDQTIDVFTKGLPITCFNQCSWLLNVCSKHQSYAKWLFLK